MKRTLFFLICISLVSVGFAEADIPNKNVQFLQAVQDGNLAAIQTLLAKGSNVNARVDNYYVWNLIAAVDNGSTKVEKLLIEDANVNAKWGATALWLAAYNGHTDVVKLLLEKGADVNPKTNSGWTALMGAARWGHTEIVKLLLEKGADVNAKDNEGGTALWYAKKRGHTDIVQILEKAGAKELAADFYLPADRLAHPLGKEAPELRQIKGWINSKPIKLTDLRGKVVLLYFWGERCFGCVTHIPDLIDLHNKYHDKGLVIICIRGSMNSVQELKKEIGRLSKKAWNGRKIPFAVALDGGGYCKVALDGCGYCKIEGIREETLMATTLGATTAAYGVRAWPTMVLIDKHGKAYSSRPGFNVAATYEDVERLLAGD
jgi:peroxiredoxin